MFEDVSGNQLTQLKKVWKAALNATSWRDGLRAEISRALATGCTLEHIAPVTGFDVDTIERLRREPRTQLRVAGTPPTPTHPDKSGSTGSRAPPPVIRPGVVPRSGSVCGPWPRSAGTAP
jgi:hypothetical protein